FSSTSHFNGDISRWDVSSVMNMQGMFLLAGTFNSDISGWDVSSVTNMDAMFLNASAFNQDLEEWKDHWSLNANGKYTGVKGTMFVGSGLDGNEPSWYQ
ncbi:MAG: BspA family leucine-rich repeat surface protein, partial [Salinispira sp.]